jgi:deoxyribodipyrimidine photo-lyase
MSNQVDFSDIDSRRIRVLRDLPIVTGRRFVLYWMVAHRRLDWNHSLQRAVHWCRELRLPLVILEAVRCDYRWASDRLHWFFIQGMKDHSRRLEDQNVVYFPYLEPRPGQGQGLVAALTKEAAVAVTDDYPCIFVPKMLQAAAKQVGCRLEAVDSNGVLPMQLAEKTYLRAVDFRRFMHKSIIEQLLRLPESDPLAFLPASAKAELPSSITKRWAPTAIDSFSREDLASLPIDHTVEPVSTEGGCQAALRQLKTFLTRQLASYEEQRRNVDQVGTSQLSPYLRFGHLAATQVVWEVLEQSGWNPQNINPKAAGSNRGFWGLPEAVESFLDELITWRELGFNLCHRHSDYDQYESLPAWARKTLQQHAQDPRPTTYTLSQFEAAETHDEIWNAAQRQLLRDGTIHNYLRMLWGKKILHWSRSPQEALEIMIHLNNKYAIDGRDPNSYSGIFWVLGRYDRAWGPEREVFGQIRYMTSESTAKKISLKNYLAKYSVQV